MYLINQSFTNALPKDLSPSPTSTESLHFIGSKNIELQKKSDVLSEVSHIIMMRVVVY